MRQPVSSQDSAQNHISHGNLKQHHVPTTTQERSFEDSEENSDRSPISKEISNSISNQKHALVSKQNQTRSSTQKQGKNLLNRDANGMIQIYAAGKMLTLSSVCARKLREFFEERLEVGVYTWSLVTKTTRDFYWHEFKKYFTWDSEMEPQIKEAWEALADRRYRDFMRDMRQETAKPPFIQDYVWKSLTTFWNTPEYKEIQERNSKNRRSNKGPASHTGGSVSFLEHGDKIARDKGREPTPFEIFSYTHTTNHDGVNFIDNVAKEFYDKVAAARLDANIDNDTLDMEVEKEIYYEAAGGEKKKRVYGLGSQASRYYPLGGKRSRMFQPTCSNTQHKEEVETLKMTIADNKTSTDRMMNAMAMMQSTMEILCK